MVNPEMNSNGLTEGIAKRISQIVRDESLDLGWVGVIMVWHYWGNNWWNNLRAS